MIEFLSSVEWSPFAHIHATGSLGSQLYFVLKLSDGSITHSVTQYGIAAAVIEVRMALYAGTS